MAEELERKTLCLYRKRESEKLSAMISGNNSFEVKNYSNLDEARKHIDKFFNGLK